MLFATDTISFKSNDIDNNTNEKENTLNNDNINDDNEILNDDVTNDNENIDSSNFVRQTRIILVNEPMCTGKDTPLVASIESNGNISISQNGESVEIEAGNAKYLYRVGRIACDSVTLYYITEEKELYVIEYPNSTTINQKTTKVIEKKVIEFLGDEHNDSGGYLKVLLESGEIEYIEFCKHSN